MIIEISIAVIAFAVVIFVIFAIRSLISVNKTLESVDKTLNDLKGKAEAAVEESTHTLAETRMLVEDIRQKSKQTDQIFHSVSEVGETIQGVSTSISKNAELHKDRLANVIALVGAGLDLTQKWRKDRHTQGKQTANGRNLK
ncbi:DUF948 domain-containing protein [Hazenella sp. IB182357]|uniref:DUF948 domain-containing protein n=1 Tax=Polycladospora coralii TaxID=2771432 RepID=A0A926NCJ2_9BACL|nr:DUF948 domain-containing protein [Polycladospora coralii]MBD1370923.1 DUF948 domain-containing protein [Polycladospora coralii]MBS7529862.1 DUF948 domain-containing protein [Polycladospora coralii]